MSIKQFISDIYQADSLVANSVVLAAVQKQYPHVCFTMRTVYYWKSVLRKEGHKIPLQKRKD